MAFAAAGDSSPMDDEIEHLFVFGAGYVGSELCRAARRRYGDGVRISATCRAGPEAPLVIEALEASGAVDDAHSFDLDYEYKGLDLAGRRALAAATHVVATVPPIADFDRDPLLALHRGGIL